MHSVSTKVFTVNLIEDWTAAWDWLKPHLKSRKCIALVGDLGAGKTTFVQTIVKQLNSTSEVTSPTFSIVQEYESKLGSVYHFDLYRMQSVEEVLDLDFENYLDQGHFIFVEWPKIAAPLLPDEDCLWIKIEHLSKSGRQLSIIDSNC